MYAAQNLDDHKGTTAWFMVTSRGFPDEERPRGNDNVEGIRSCLRK